MHCYIIRELIGLLQASYKDGGNNRQPLAIVSMGLIVRFEKDISMFMEAPSSSNINLHDFHHQNSFTASVQTFAMLSIWVLFSDKSARLPTWYFLKYLSSSTTMATGNDIFIPETSLMNVVRLHGEDNVAIKRYVISFWNGVDLRYKLLQGPSVKISIAGIIISRVISKFILSNL